MSQECNDNIELRLDPDSLSTKIKTYEHVILKKERMTNACITSSFSLFKDFTFLKTCYGHASYLD